MRFWILFFGMGVYAFISGVALQYGVWPLVTTFGMLSVGTLAIIIKEWKPEGQ